MICGGKPMRTEWYHLDDKLIIGIAHLENCRILHIDRSKREIVVCGFPDYFWMRIREVLNKNEEEMDV